MPASILEKSKISLINDSNDSADKKAEEAELNPLEKAQKEVEELKKQLLYKTAEFEKNLAYDGTDTGSGRFAPGNEIEIKNQKTGDAKIVLNEKRDEMKTAEKKQKENDSLGR